MALFSGYLTVKSGLPVKSEQDQVLEYTVDQSYFAYFLLMGHVLINFIFLFMFLLAKIIDKNMSIPCIRFLHIKEQNNSNNDVKDIKINCLICNRHCNWIHKIFCKYPYIVFANCIIVLGYFIIFLWWYIDKFLYNFIS